MLEFKQRNLGSQAGISRPFLHLKIRLLAKGEIPRVQIPISPASKS
jgi:hypothetical protein